MRGILLAILILMLHACTGSKNRDNKILSYLKDPNNHLVQKVMCNNGLITIKYLPKEVQMMLDRKNGYNSDDKSYDEFLHFEININKKNFKKEDENIINYQNFYIQNDFKLVNVNDTITPSICEKINNGIKDDNQYIVVFAKPVKLSDKFSLIYDDKLFGIGKQQFLYYTDEFEKIPSFKNE